MSQAVPHVTSWRGSKSSSWSLMAHLWRSEEADISVSHGHLGTLEGMYSAPPSGPAVVCGCVCTNWPSIYLVHCAHIVFVLSVMNSPLSFAFPFTSPPPLSYPYPSNPCPPSLPFPFPPPPSFLPFPSLHADMRHPLMGAAQRTEQDSTVGERLGSSCVPPSIRDVTDNLRARIFSLCSKIGQCASSAALLPCCPVQCVCQPLSCDVLYI